MNYRHTVIISLGILIACATRSAAWAQGIAVTIDRARLGLNEDFTLSVEISGRNAGEPKLPDMSSFAALAGRSSSQNIQFVNGRMSASTTINYTFLAQAAGSFEIGAVEVEIDGQVQRSQPIRIEIVAAAAPPAAGQQPQAPAQTDPAVQGEDSALFLRAELDRRTVYQNEPVSVTYKIYTLPSCRASPVFGWKISTCRSGRARRNKRSTGSAIWSPRSSAARFFRRARASKRWSP